jgi:hypothetical protein
MREEYGGQGRNRTADASLFRAAGFSSRDCAPRECFPRYGAQHRSPPARQFYNLKNLWWPGTESNRRRQPFQGCALPTELPGHFGWVTYVHLRWDRLKTLCVRNVSIITTLPNSLKPR